MISIVTLFIGVSFAWPINKIPWPFRPSSMDLMSDVAGHFAKNYTYEIANDPVLSSYYDSFLLPSRAAVERVPTFEER